MFWSHREDEVGTSLVPFYEHQLQDNFSRTSTMGVEKCISETVWISNAIIVVDVYVVKKSSQNS